MYDSLSDNELIALHKSGNADAFAEIYSRYGVTVKRIARSYFLLGGDLDDVAQEGLLGLLKAADTFDENRGASFKTHAANCIRQKVFDAVKRYNSKGNMPLNFASDIDGENISAPDLEDTVIGEESGTEFMASLRNYLSKTEYSILSSYLDGHNYGEISSLTGKSEKAIDNALQRARKKIRKII